MPVAASSDATNKQETICARCQTQPSTILVRAEHLCSDCFKKYITTKALKRLESNKIRGGFNDPVKTLLLPISFGVSSIALLHILDQQLSNRAEQSRHAGYKLHVLFVDQSSVSGRIPAQSSIDLLQQRYPLHTFRTICIDDISDYNTNIGQTLYGAHRYVGDLISSLPSATSKRDFIDTTRRRLIFAYAAKNNCDSIVFGDSTTRLAERTLSETAKGRGNTLPLLTADGDTSGINIIYPLRDVLRKELLIYTGVVSPPLSRLIFETAAQTPTSSKDITIDGLMSQYFESVEQHYPSIVANVVRTAGKLKKTPTQSGAPCSLCGNAVTHGTWGGEQDESMPTQGVEHDASALDDALCYGCSRTMLKG